MVSFKIALAATIAIATTALLPTHAQLSTIPRRYRSTNTQLTSSSVSKRRTLQKQQHHQQKKRQGGNNLRTRNLDEQSMPLESAEMSLLILPRGSMPSIEQSDMSLPIKLRMDELDNSMPLEESRFDISMPLEESRFDISMPLNVFDMSMSMPTEGDIPKDEDLTVVLGENESGSATLILASFLAGLSVLVVGAMACFVKMRKVHNKQVLEEREEDFIEEQRQVAASRQQREVIANHLNDFEEGDAVHDISIY